VNNNGSLYERIGGENPVTAAVGLLYQKILADETLRHFFAGLDMQAQVKKQVSFMTLAFGGPASYSGKDLREAHARLVSRGMSDVHFDAVVRHVKDSLEELGVAQELIDEVLGRSERCGIEDAL
jgi:hemoglobin